MLKISRSDAKQLVPAPNPFVDASGDHPADDPAAPMSYSAPRIVEIGRIGSATFGASGIEFDFGSFQNPV